MLQLFGAGFQLSCSEFNEPNVAFALSPWSFKSEQSFEMSLAIFLFPFSVSKRLARFQHCRDPFLCLAFAAERNESLAFKIEHVLFADECFVVHIAARHNVC